MTSHMKLSIPLRMKRLGLTESLPHLLNTFNSLEDETLYTLSIRSDWLDWLSIPLRIKPISPHYLHALSDTFQFPWGWNKKTGRIRRRTWTVKLSIPLRMKHSCTTVSSVAVFYFQFPWGWNWNSNYNQFGFIDLSIPLRMKHYEGKKRVGFNACYFQFPWGWNLTGFIGYSVTSLFFQFPWGWNPLY